MGLMNDTLQMVLWIVLGATPLVLVLLSTVLFRVQGTWLRADGIEELRLRQRLVFVNGRSEQYGGWHEYNGYMLGPWLLLERRDHGQQLLEGQGFPPAVAPQVANTVVARLRLWSRVGGTELAGSFVPQQVVFSGQPPLVTQRIWQKPQARLYKRIS